MRNKKATLAVLTGFLLTLPVMLFAAFGRGGGGRYFHDPRGYASYWLGGHFFGGGLFMLIITLIILGFLIFFAVKYFRNTKEDSLKKENPIDILKIRYAKGEISKEEFNNMKKEIGAI